MVYHERAAWTGLITTVLALGVYIALLATSDDPVGGWVPIMLWTIGGGIVLTIVATIVWGIVVGMRDRESASASDMRDTDIAHLGGRVEHSLLAIAGVAVIVLCALQVDLFWIAQAMFAGFAVSTLAGGVARVIAYRRGLV